MTVKPITLLLTISLGFLSGACITSEADVEAAIQEARYCQVAADCVDVGGSCPFGCSIAVNADEADNIRALIQKYHDDHPGQMCMYDCVMTEGLDCVDSQCVTLYSTL